MNDKNYNNESVEFDFSSEDEIKDVNFVMVNESGKDSKDNEATDYDKSVKSTNKPWKKMIGIGLVFMIVFGLSVGAGIALFSPTEYTQPSKETLEASSDGPKIVKQVVLSQEEMNTVDIVENVGPSVVGITSKVRYTDWYNNVRTNEGSGSGVIFKKDSDKIYILTNNHVIDEANELLVEIKKGDFKEAEIIGKDSIADLAVIAIENKAEYHDILPVEFADSDALKAGQKVIALGNPLGYNNTVTTGVVSALDRDLDNSNPFKLIQTDAAINPGNSGGALLNSRGQLIGVNTVKISDTSVEGIGFAIPSNAARPILDELLEKGFISRPYLGIYGREIDDNLAEIYGIPMGIYVSATVEGTGAASSGLQKSDIIIGLDDHVIMTMEDLSNVLNKYEVGDTVDLKIVRDGKEKMTLKVKLTQRTNK